MLLFFKNCFVSFESSFMDHSHSSPSLFSATCMRSASDLSEPMASQVTSETLLETFEIFGKRSQARRPTCPTLKWQNFEVLRKRDKSKQTETRMTLKIMKANHEKRYETSKQVPSWFPRPTNDHAPGAPRATGPEALHLG